MRLGGEDFVNPTEGGLRGCDSYGCGGYGASRAASPHDGADYISSPGQVVQSPVDGVVVRVSNPYAGDSRYSGLVVNSAGGHQVTVWYISPNAGVVGTTVYAGQGNRHSPKSRNAILRDHQPCARAHALRRAERESHDTHSDMAVTGEAS